MKKIALLLSVVLLLLPTAVLTHAFAPGDVDGNGTLEAADARLALRGAVGLEQYAPGSDQFNAADADQNGTLEAADARLILRAAVGLESLAAQVIIKCSQFSLSLPADWAEKFDCESTDASILVYHKAVRAATGNGLIFGIDLADPEDSGKDPNKRSVRRLFAGDTEYYMQLLITGDDECPAAYEDEYYQMIREADEAVQTLKSEQAGVYVEPFDFSAFLNDYECVLPDGGKLELSLYEADDNILAGEIVKTEPDGSAFGSTVTFRMARDTGFAMLGEGEASLRAEGENVLLRMNATGIDGWDNAAGFTLRQKVISTEPPAAKLSSGEVYRTAAAFTYEITAYADDSVSTGSGFAINRDGWIVTNYHVIAGASYFTAQSLAGIYYPVTQVIAFDRDLDLAILKISHARDWARLNKKTYATGDQIYTLGSSKGLTGSFSSGVIAEKSRKLDGLPVTFIQISAPISPGNSGGPLLNEYGEVIGVNSRTYNEGQNLNFAIPVSYLDALDTSNPLTAEEFAALEADTTGDDPYTQDENAVLIPYDELLLWPGGTAFVPVIANYDGGDFSVTYDVGGEGVRCSWSEWISPTTIYLFVTVTDTAHNIPVTVYITGHPEISYTVTVTASEYGGEETYFCPTAVPDAGAIWNVPSESCSVSGDTSLKTVSYAGSDLRATGKNANQLRADYEARLSFYGFQKVDYYINEADTQHVYTYYSETSCVTVNFFEYYDSDTGALTGIAVDFFDPILVSGEG